MTGRSEQGEVYKYEDLVRMMGEIISALEGKIRVSDHLLFPFESKLRSREGMEGRGYLHGFELPCSGKPSWTQRARGHSCLACTAVGPDAGLTTPRVVFLRSSLPTEWVEGPSVC